MGDRPRIGYADKAQGAHLHAPVRYLPIIIVPGFMGTRLTDPKTGSVAWNPLGKPFGEGPRKFSVDYARLTQTSAELIPDEDHGLRKPDPLGADPSAKDKKEFDQESTTYTRHQRVRHASHLVADFYGELIDKLSTLQIPAPADKPVTIKPRIYCCGYDWRLDNAKSALRLAAMVEEALAETREKQVVILAHGMGGLVARYYCRVLGGEPKVFRLFLLASPTLGQPEAYTNLKHGIPGLYVRDFIEDTDTKDRIAEGVNEFGTLSTMIGTAIGGTRGWQVVQAAIGLHFVLCLGSGRYLRRKETLYFMRQLPAAYQLLPGALYCREHPWWLLFDPLATGHLPTGYMLLFPTLLQLVNIKETYEMAQNPGEPMEEKAKHSATMFLAPEEAERTSPMARLNREWIWERFEKIGELISAKKQEVRLGLTDDSDLKKRLDAAKSAAEVAIRFDKFFLNARNNSTLYNDIFTGLLDLPEQRALCAANLALAYRFDQALTVDPYPIPPVNPFSALLREVKLQGVFGKGGQKSEQEEEDKWAKPKAYMHPGTYNAYCDSEVVEAGGILLSTDILSNFDANIVRWVLFPSSLGFLFTPGIAAADRGSSFAQTIFGDGAVPIASANPPKEVISAPFLEEPKVVKNIQHHWFCNEPTLIDWVTDKLKALTADFLSA